MISLPKLLLDAAERDASEIVIQTGQRPIIRTPQSSGAFGDPVTESELFEALTLVLSPEQQAELAVGNVVEFKVHVTAGGDWSLISEPGADGITVRGRNANAPEPAAEPGDGTEVGAPVDLPPLAPFEPDLGGDVPIAPQPVLRRRTQLDVGLADYAPDDPPWKGEPEPTPPLPDQTPGKSPLPPPPPVAGLESSDAVDFAIVPGAHPEDAPPQGEAAPADGATPDVPATPDGGNALPNPALRPTGEAPAVVASTPDAPPLREPRPTPPPAPPVPPTPTAGVPARPPESTPATRSDLAPLASRFLPGTICFARAQGGAELLARTADAPIEVYDEPRSVELGGRMLSELVEGATYVVRLEDPSRAMPWILRRVEEGSRVVVETRARDLDGAKRIFVGLGGPSAREWLAAHPIFWLDDEGGEWTLERDGAGPRGLRGRPTADVEPRTSEPEPRSGNGGGRRATPPLAQ